MTVNFISKIEEMPVYSSTVQSFMRKVGPSISTMLYLTGQMIANTSVNIT